MVIIRQEIAHSEARHIKPKVSLGLIIFRQSLVETKARIWVIIANMAAMEVLNMTMDGLKTTEQNI